jgi:hypothetical protein
MLFPWNFRTQVKSIYYSHLHLTTACKRPTLSPTNLRHRPPENTSLGRYPLLCDVTVCLLSRCWEQGCITLLFHRWSAQTTHLNLLSTGRQVRNEAQKERQVCSKTFQQIRQYTVTYKRKVVKVDGTELILVKYNHETQGIVFWSHQF